MSGKLQAAILAFLLAGCASNSTALAAGAAQVEALHANTADAFLALVDAGNASESVKDFYRVRIRANIDAVRALTDAQVALAEALGKIDWQAEALKAWKLFREKGKQP